MIDMAALTYPFLPGEQKWKGSCGMMKEHLCLTKHSSKLLVSFRLYPDVSLPYIAYFCYWFCFSMESNIY